MKDKCSKYESLFIFSDDETLKKHISECEDCRYENEKMQKVSELINEVKFYYRKKQKKIINFKIACAMSLVLFSTLSIGVMTTNDDIMDTLMYGDALTAEDLGFPVDSYGLIMVD